MILPVVKSDLARGKKTLPNIIANLQKEASPTDIRTDDALLEEAIKATWSACLVYRNHIRASLERLVARVKRPLSSPLEYLIGVT